MARGSKRNFLILTSSGKRVSNWCENQWPLPEEIDDETPSDSIKMKAKLIVLAIALLICFPLQNVSIAEDDSKLEDVLGGFEDGQDAGDGSNDVMDGFEDDAQPGIEPREMSDEDILEEFESGDDPSQPAVTERGCLPSFLSIDGYLKLSSVYAYQAHDAAGTDTSWQGLTRLRPEIKLIVDADLSDTWQARVSGHAFYDPAYALNGRGSYSDDVLDSYEKEMELDEVYLLGSLTTNLDLKAGRQVIVWGRSDNIRITDVLNPLDLRWPGLVDIEKLRLPATMTRLDYYHRGWNFSGIALHEVRYNKNPEFGSDFFPGTQALPGQESPDEGFSIENTQFAASLNGIFQGWDVSFYFADIYAQNGYIAPTAQVPAPPLEIKHPRIKMFGGAFNMARGNWLFKSEAAYFDGFEFASTPDKDFSRLDALAGVDYSGISDATITLELANRHTFDFDKRLEDSPDFQKEDLFEWAVRISKPYWNDTLNLTVLATIFGPTGDDGGFQRFTAEYDWTDSVELTGGIVFYQSGDLRRTMGIGDNDRVFLEVQYNF